MPDKTTTIKQLRDICEKFRKERGWNEANAATFAKAIAVEAGELLDLFVWDEQLYVKNLEIAKAVRHEIADVLFLILIMSKVLSLDLSTIVKEKLIIQAKKYPAKKCQQKMKEKDAGSWLWNQRKKFRNKK